MMAAVLAMTPGVSEAKKRTDHALLCRGSCGGGDTAIYCGLAPPGRPYNLHIAASTFGAGAGVLKLTFQDGDFMKFDVPADGSFSMTHALGGVPGIDDVVKITGEGGVETIMASLHRKKKGKDPFDEKLDGGDAENDNYCITAPDSDGVTSAEAMFP